MLTKYERRLQALEKILNRPLPPKVFLHPRYYADGRPLPPEIIAMYKRGLTKEEGQKFFFLRGDEKHVYLSPQENEEYQAQRSYQRNRHW